MKVEIQIVNQVWSFQSVDSHDSRLMVDGKPCLGTTWPVQQAMYISNELNPGRAARTIRHEMTHAFLAATQLSEPSKYSEEDLCELVAIYGPAIMQASDHVFRRLLCEDKGVLTNEGISA